MSTRTKEDHERVVQICHVVDRQERAALLLSLIAHVLIDIRDAVERGDG